MSTKWKIYCTEPGDVGFHEAWSDTPITTCPNNPAHSVNPNSVAPITEEVQQYRFFPAFNSKIKSSNFTRIATFEYNPDVSGPIYRIKIIGNIDGEGSYDVELYDVTHHTQLSVNTFSNEDPDVIQVGLAVSSPPTETCLLEINVKKTSGDRKREISIYQVIIYGEK